MDRKMLAQAFDRWEDDYIAHPEQFEREFDTIREHLRERGDGTEPSYGQKAAAALLKYIEQLRAEPKNPEPPRRGDAEETEPRMNTDEI